MASVEQIEHLLRSLQGVVSVRAVLSSNGQPREIHVLAGPDLHPKQVVRNIESALTAGLGLEIDRRVVSVSQLRPGAGSDSGSAVAGPPNGASATARVDTPAVGRRVPAAGTGKNGDGLDGQRPEAKHDGARASDPVIDDERVVLAGFRSHSRSARETACEVLLRHRGREFSGSAEGPDTTHGRADAAARAAVSALGLTAPEAGLALEGVALVQSGGRSYVVVSVQGLEARRPVALVGAAILDRSPEEAAVLAALQATNRWASRGRPGST